MTEHPATWRHAFDLWEDLTASQLDRLMRTEVFARALSLTVTSAGTARRLAEDAVSGWLHLWGLPSRRDVHELHDLLMSLDRRVRDLDRLLGRTTAGATDPD